MSYLVKYVRTKDNIPYGCFVATGRDQIGFSICDPREQFEKVVARGMAFLRVVPAEESIQIMLDHFESYKGKHPHITEDVIVQLLIFRRRINKYYQEISDK